MTFMDFDFTLKFFLLQCKKMRTLKLISEICFAIFAFKVFFSFLC